LNEKWRNELTAMCRRIADMRGAIHELLSRHIEGETLARYIKQRGMFTYTGLSAEQVDRLREQYGVYILRSGRMCVAGLNERNVGAVAQAIAKVVANAA